MQQLFQLDPSSWSPAELAIFGLTYPLWIVAYILMIRRAHIDKQYAAPLVAAAVMFSFEFCFIFVWPIGEGIPEFAYAKWFEYAWFAMDIILLIQVGLYAPNSMPDSPLGKHPWLSVIGVTGLCMFGMWAFVDWTGMKDGVVPAILAVSIIACQFPIFIQEREQNVASLGKKADGISFWGIALRGIGDATTALSTVLIFAWVGGDQRPSAPETLTEGLGYSLLSVPNDPAESFIQIADGTQFALAPISAYNPWTLFLLAVMLLCDAWVILVLAKKRGEKRKAAAKA